MIISHLKLLNWKNFHKCDVRLSERCFVVGANASGKSNFLDVFRFLHDIVKAGGGLQTAVANRGGVSKIRCLTAKGRNASNISIVVGLKNDLESESEDWEYTLTFKQLGGGFRKLMPIVVEEIVKKKNNIIVNRGELDKSDPEMQKYTYLELPSANRDFRELKQFFDNLEYMNVIPQLVRESNSILMTSDKEDFYGRNFLQRMSLLNEQTTKSYFAKINEVLKVAVPQLENLRMSKDEMGIPHLEARYIHWRERGARQQEEQFSDGTLRLIGFLYALLDCKGTILLEEPESNLHSAIVSHFPEFISRMQRGKKELRQVIVTTHSYDMLSSPGIGRDDILLLTPSLDGTLLRNVDEVKDVKDVLEAGMSAADAIINYTAPSEVSKLSQL